MLICPERHQLIKERLFNNE